MENVHLKWKLVYVQSQKLGDKYVGREIKYRNTHNENRRLLRLGFWYILIYACALACIIVQPSLCIFPI